MSAPKSTVDQIRARFDADVERFSNLETGQSATIDSPLCLELVASAAIAVTPNPRDLLDIGCGAGNYTLKLLEKLTPNPTTTGAAPAPPAINCTLIDLSQPMLDRAVQRIGPKTSGTLRPLQGDMRDLDFGDQSTDIIVTASTFHHLRSDPEWHAIYQKCFRALRPGGSFWIFDLLDHAHPAVEALMRKRYSDYLVALKGGGPEGEAYRDHVFAYVAQEDTPKPLMFQLELLRTVGFTDIDVLHKNAMGAAFGGRKP